jgi:tetratricopeptide (TPR) repeat protein
MLAWAYEEKSQQLSHKAREVKANQNDLLKKSLEHIEISLELAPQSISALEQRAELLFALKNYSEALKTIDFVLTKKKKEINIHIFRAYILIRLKEWDLALKELKNIENLLKLSKTDIEYTKLTINVYRAEILHGQGKHKQAWEDIWEAWETSPEEIIKYFGSANFVNNIIQKVPTIESRYFHIELLYFRATEFLKVHEYETATELADLAATLLNDIKLLEQMEVEPIVVGEVKFSFIQSTLERIAKLLRNRGNKIFAEEQINKISNWFERTYKEEPTFLGSLQRKSKLRPAAVSEDDVEKLLLAEGVISEIPDRSPDDEEETYEPITVKGNPLSEMILENREK